MKKPRGFLKFYVFFGAPVLALGGLAFSWLTISAAMEKGRLGRTGTAAAGRVVSVHERRHSTTSGGPRRDQSVVRRSTEQLSYWPEVEFTAADGRTFRFVSRMGALRPVYRVGQAVPIVYDPANPRRAELRSEASVNFVSVWPAFFGLLLFAMAVLPALIIWQGGRRPGRAA